MLKFWALPLRNGKVENQKNEDEEEKVNGSSKIYQKIHS